MALFEENGIRYETLQEKHIEDLRPVFAGSIKGEPVGVMQGINDHPDMGDLICMCHLDVLKDYCIGNDISVVAIDAETGKAVGCFTGLDHGAIEINFSFLTKAYPMYKKM